MNLQETNYIYYIKDFLGIHNNGDNILPKNTRRRPNLISNPLLVNLIHVYRPEPGSLNTITPRALVDVAYTKVVGHLLNYLKPELNTNPSYKQEIKRKMLNSKFGVFSTALSELFVGGYLKYAGFKVKFNSSKETGQPDILASIGNQKIANEVKQFPDGESWLEDTISSMMPKFAEILNHYSNINLFTFVSKIEGFRKNIINTMETLLKTGQGGKTDTCWVVNMAKSPFKYAGNEGILISNPATRSQLRFKVSFDSGKATDDLFEKALTQQKESSAKGVTWMFFPHPKEISLERKIVWLASGIPAKMKENGSDMVLFDVVPIFDNSKNELGIRSGIDFSVDAKFSEKLNKKTFNSFIDFLILQPTLLVS